MSNLTYHKYPKLVFNTITPTHVLNCGTFVKHSFQAERLERYIGPTHDGTRAELELGGGGSGFKNSATLLYVSTDKVFEG
jgi:dTDP-4-dehydrorhamnose reductase